MKKISITKIKKALASLHVRYTDFCQVYKENEYTVEICVQYASWLKDDIKTVIDYLKDSYNVEERMNGSYLVTEKNVSSPEVDTKLSTSQIGKMKHSLGMDNKKPSRGKYEAYRNFYNTSKDDPELEHLVNIGFASKRVASENFPGIWYHITDKGINYLSEIMNIQITEMK